MALSFEDQWTTLKRGWLSIRYPDNQVPKDFYAILRPYSLDCYGTAAEAERKPDRISLQLHLKNCIMIQSLKQESVKNGFSLLIVPNGLYVLNAVSETEKLSWLKHIREAISHQNQLDMEAAAASTETTDKKRKKSLGITSPKLGHRTKHTRNKQAQQSGSVQELNRTGSDNYEQAVRQHIFNQTSVSHLPTKVTSSEISLQDKRSKLYNDDKTSINRSSSQQSQISVRGIATADSRSNRRMSAGSDNQRNTSERKRSSGSDNASNVSLKILPTGRTSALGSMSSIGRNQEQGMHRPRGSTPTGGYGRSDDMSDGSQTTLRGSTENLTQKQPYRTHSPASSHGGQSVHNVNILRPSQSPTTSNRSNPPLTRTSSTHGFTNSADHRTSVESFTGAYKGSQPMEQRLQPQMVITISRDKKPDTNYAGFMSSPIPYAAHQMEPDMNRLNESNKTSEKNSIATVPPTPSPVTANNNQPLWKNAGVSPPSNRLLTDNKRSMLFAVNRDSVRKHESKIKSIQIERDYLRKLQGIDSQDSLYLENQKLREQIRALTTTNYELEAKINVVSQRAMPNEVFAHQKHTTNSRIAGRLENAKQNTSNFIRPGTPREVDIPSYQRHATSDEPDYVDPNERVQSWLLNSPKHLPTDQAPKENRSRMERRLLDKARRNTTSAIPTPESLCAMGLLSSPLNDGENTHPQGFDQTHLKTIDACDHLKNRGRSLSTVANNFEQANGLQNTLNAKSTLTSTSRILTPALPEPIDPRYASSMWCRLVDLWSKLLNEERGFWKSQLQHLFTESLKRNFETDPNDLIEVLDKANVQHTEEIVNLWRHIYESWIPRDYLDYFAAETGKLLVVLHSVIDGLVSMIDDIRHNENDPLMQQRLDALKEKIARTRGPDIFDGDQDDQEAHGRRGSLGNTRNFVNGTVNSNSFGLSISPSHSSDMPSVRTTPRENSDSWYQTKRLLKQSHSELLDQVYNVAELVGAALDADMEDTIRSAKASGEHRLDPLTSLPPSGLQAAAKLQSIVLDLESRLESAADVDLDRDPIIVNDLQMTPRVIKGNNANNNFVSQDGNYEDENTYNETKQHFTVISARPARYSEQESSISKETHSNGPVVWVIKDNEEMGLYRRNAERIPQRYPSGRSDEFSIDSNIAEHHTIQLNSNRYRK